MACSYVSCMLRQCRSQILRFFSMFSQILVSISKRICINVSFWHRLTASNNVLNVSMNISFWHQLIANSNDLNVNIPIVAK